MSTLDEMVGERRVDFIKMDVQGWEGEVFQGMKNVLEKNPGIIIYFEFWKAYEWRAVIRKVCSKAFHNLVFSCSSTSRERSIEFRILRN